MKFTNNIVYEYAKMGVTFNNHSEGRYTRLQNTQLTFKNAIEDWKRVPLRLWKIRKLFSV